MRLTALLAALSSVCITHGQIQAPAPACLGAPISSSDRVYTSDQSSNTITVINPVNNTVLGTIALGSPRLSDVIGPQYIRSVNSHGLGFSRDGKYIVSLSVTSNTVTVIRAIDNAIISKAYVDRNPHEAFFAPDNRTIWIGTRGVDTISLLDAPTGSLISRIPSYGGPSKVLFSPDGKTAYINHIRAPSISVINVETRAHIANITGLAHVFSSDMMLSADGSRLWVAHKLAGKVSVVSTASHRVVSVLETGPETNHPNFADLAGTTYGFVTVGSRNATLVFTQRSAEEPPVYVGAIPSSGVQPHGLWPSADNTRLYVLNEHSDTVDVVDLTMPRQGKNGGEGVGFRIVDTISVGQEGQALVYVAGAVPEGPGTQNLGTQGLGGGETVNTLLTVENPDARNQGEKNVTATALVNVRPAVGVDMFKVIGRNLKLNTTYTVLGEPVRYRGKGVSVPLLSFNATGTTLSGCGTAPQVLGFFRFKGVYDGEGLRLVEGEGV